jgi:hypothetical protein
MIDIWFPVAFAYFFCAGLCFVAAIVCFSLFATLSMIQAEEEQGELEGRAMVVRPKVGW